MSKFQFLFNGLSPEEMEALSEYFDNREMHTLSSEFDSDEDEEE